MIFKGEPNLFVRITIPAHQRQAGRKSFSFNSSGLFETENTFLINLLKRQYEVVENNVQGEEIKVMKCKKCNFETDNKGLLMAHYREHKKEE